MTGSTHIRTNKMATNGTGTGTAASPVSIGPLLRHLEPMLKREPLQITDDIASEIALAISDVFARRLSEEQTAVLLHDLYLTGFEQHPLVLAKCAQVMRDAAEPVDIERVRKLIGLRKASVNSYNGGLVSDSYNGEQISTANTNRKCDIVGTGGDNHKTFNISTASSIICSSLLAIAKHGNRASTSRSGSSDVLSCMRLPDHPKLDVVGPQALEAVYAAGNYGFLFAPNFHKGLRHVAAIRKQLPHPSLFNLLGPLTNPLGPAIEARVVGVKRKDLVPVFAEALRLSGAKKALVVCGDEDLDEISPAGPTHCARLVESANGETEIQRFMLQPADFGMPEHPLKDVAPGNGPEENAKLLQRILSNEVEDSTPVLHFVLINAAALFEISGATDGTHSAFNNDATVDATVGPGNGRWREGVRLAKEALASGRALDMITRFANVTLTAS